LLRAAESALPWTRSWNPSSVPSVTIVTLTAPTREKACHQKIDPPGFALESFDPIGGFRDRYRSLGSGDKTDAIVRGRQVRYRLGPPVDSSGQFPDGQPFDNYKQFRD
jgi:hypothetical protein